MLVIIGLIVGGVLVGQDLIKAAGVRATIAQIEKYNTAANTFKVKYGYLPGDIPDPYASQFGFAARGQYAGEGDGNGVIEGVWQNSAGVNGGIDQGVGEAGMFWVDLSVANMIDGNFNASMPSTFPFNAVSVTGVNAYMPAAKTGPGAYIFVSSGGVGGGNGINYFMLSGMSGMAAGGGALGVTTLPVSQMYMIDKKTDDGYPLTGKVAAQFVNAGVWWAGIVPANSTWATPETATTCYDNGGVTGGTQQYSMGALASYGSSPTCALSFAMQGAAR